MVFVSYPRISPKSRGCRGEQCYEDYKAPLHIRNGGCVENDATIEML